MHLQHRARDSYDDGKERGPDNTRPPLLTIGLVSGIALAYEVLLMRLFSIIQYHHFASMIISLALLGYGASGTFLVWARPRLLACFPAALPALLLLFGSTLVGGFLAAQHISFNPAEFFWAPRQFGLLLIIYLLLAVPFFFAATVVALALSRYPRRIGRVYGADLLGAGLGSPAIMVLLLSVFPQKALLLLGGLALAAAGIAWLEMRLSPGYVAWLLFLPALVVFLVPAHRSLVKISAYKPLSQQLRIPGSRIVAERSSPLGLLTLVENNRVPLRRAPGMSLATGMEPPPQLGLFTDGGGMQVITRYTGDKREIAYLDQLPSALPYHLFRPERVLIPAAGTGSRVLQALYHETPQIEAVELNPQVVELVRARGDFAGDVYGAGNSRVKVHIAEGRDFLAGSDSRYDLIQLSVPGGAGGLSAGPYSLETGYLFTVEALVACLQHLRPSGFLAITCRLKLPPRDSLKLAATAVTALRRKGIEEAAKSLMFVRGWQTGTLLIKNGVITADEVAGLLSFAEKRSFDPVYYPGIQTGMVNRYNRLRRPYYYESISGLLQQEDRRFFQRYKFRLEPATDDRPYFYHYFRWNALPEILRLRKKGGMALLESGYLVQVATLFQALVVSLLLILLPLAPLIRGKRASVAGQSRLRVLMFFTCIGLAFLFLEIACLQKFSLFLGQPLYSAAIVLTSFLLFAGLGSRGTGKAGQAGERKEVRRAVGWIGLTGLVMIVVQAYLLTGFSSQPLILKMGAAVVLIAPLAFWMGRPFPIGLSRLAAGEEALLPWAWAVNGCASVVGAVLAVLLSIHFGFTAVVFTALILYALAAWLFPVSPEDDYTPGCGSCSSMR